MFGTPTGPSRSFLFGVDQVGEDVFSRVLYGARVSLEVAFVATGLSVGSASCGHAPATSGAGSTP